MSDATLIADVQLKMAQLSATQEEVAWASGITQPHLSKILSFKVTLGHKARSGLSGWLSLASGPAPDGADAQLAAKVARLERLAPHKRMQVMHLLDIVERMLRS